MSTIKLTGLIPATLTPFNADGSLDLAAIEGLAAHLIEHQLPAAFIGGSTGEGQSLSFEERRQLTRRWMEVTRGSQLKVVAHVGSNCLPDAQALAGEANDLGVAAISALPSYYFRPTAVESLVEWCAEIAGAAPDTPFYFYHVPAMTQVNLSMPALLAQAADRIPSFNGIKFSSNDLLTLQRCLDADGGAFDILWGVDECLLAGVTTGARGAIGSTYNFAAPVFQRLMAAIERNDLATAREQQRRGAALVALLLQYGFVAASRVIMEWQGVRCGPCRRPLPNLNAELTARLRRDLEELGFFEWVRTPGSAAAVSATGA